MISNWGAHYFDMVQWASRPEDSGPVEVEGHGEFPNSLWDTMINFKVHYRYANGLEMTCEQTPTSTPAITYFGSDGWIKVDKHPGIMTSSKAALVTHEPEKGEEDFSKILWDKNDFIASIREAGLDPANVGLLRHSISTGKGIIELWQNNRPGFEVYQSLQAIGRRAIC
jgi:hypothetical protein